MSKNTKRSQKKRADLTPYSFTEPVVRVLQSKTEGKLRPHYRSGSSRNADAKIRVNVFHKRQDKEIGADILGTRNLSIWRKSSGQSKSWKNCRRVKLRRDYLELLSGSNGRPVSFGWQFSVTNTPTSFARGQGLHANKQSRSRRSKKLRGVPAIENLDEEYTPESKDPPRQHWRIRQAIRSQGTPDGLPRRYLRLNITRDAVSIVAEKFLKRVRLTKVQPLRLCNAEQQTEFFA